MQTKKVIFHDLDLNFLMVKLAKTLLVDKISLSRIFKEICDAEVVYAMRFTHWHTHQGFTVTRIMHILIGLLILILLMLMLLLLLLP